MKVRCIDASDTPFSAGEVLEVDYQSPSYYGFRGVHGGGWSKRRFEPVPDESEAPAEQPKESERKLCRNPLPEDIYDSASFSDGYLHWSTGFASVHSGFTEPVVGGKSWREALMTYPAEQPKVDPYEEARRHDATLREMTDAKQPGATARLLRGLEGEKVRERVRAFPHPARNPR